MSSTEVSDKIDGVTTDFIKASASNHALASFLVGRCRLTLGEKVAVGWTGLKGGEDWAFSINPLCWVCWGCEMELVLSVEER
jgi:hypothetical protein